MYMYTAISKMEEEDLEKDKFKKGPECSEFSAEKVENCSNEQGDLPRCDSEPNDAEQTTEVDVNSIQDLYALKGVYQSLNEKYQRNMQELEETKKLLEERK